MRRGDGQIRTLAELTRAFADLRSTVLTRLANTARGQLGYAQVTADQTGISSLTDLTGLTTTVSVGTNRRIRITGKVRLIQRTGAGSVVGGIREGGTDLGRYGTHTLQTNEFDLFEGSVVLTPSAGSHTYKLTLLTTANTVDALATATAGLVNFILVEDIGPA